MSFDHTFNKGVRFKAAALLIMFVAAYWVPLKAMIDTWSKNEDYSYGFFIPIVSAYLLWDMRSRLKSASIKSSWIVFPVLLFLVLLSAYGILGSSGNISMPTVPLLVICFTAFCFGIDPVRRLILPLGFLVFMVPVPAVIERTIGMYLKSVSSRLGGEIIRLFNISVNVSGNIIDLGATQLQVVDACNGLRYVFPLFALGIIYAYFFERVAWKRIFCVLATIPIAIMTNALRIGITGILTKQYGAGVAEGFFHGFSGWVLFMVAFCLLFLIGRVLTLFPPKSAKTPPVSPRTCSTARHDNSNGAFVTSLIMLFIVAGLSLSTKALPPIKLNGGIESFPLAFSEWSGKSEPVDTEIINASGAEEAFNGVFANSKGDNISLYIGYRGTAFLANENFFHSPTVCLPSAGWETIGTSTRIIPGVPVFGQLKVTQMIVSNLGDTSVVYFWFQTKNKATYDKNMNRFDLALHAVLRDNTYDLFIRTITKVKPSESQRNAEERMDAFVREMTAALQNFIETNQNTASVK
jgi:exosortase D (VPLPA-CTERM-specific)